MGTSTSVVQLSRTVRPFILIAWLTFVGISGSALGQSSTLKGTLELEPAIKPGGNAYAIIKLLDVTIADAQAVEIARTQLTRVAGSSVLFELRYKRGSIDRRNSYVLAAEVFQKDSGQRYVRTHISKQSYPVFVSTRPACVVIRAEGT